MDDERQADPTCHWAAAGRIDEGFGTYTRRRAITDRSYQGVPHAPAFPSLLSIVTYTLTIGVTRG